MNSNGALCKEVKQVPSKNIRYHPIEVEWFQGNPGKFPCYNPYKADIWYLGAVLIEMVYGLMPIPHREADNRELPEGGNEEFKKLLREMLHWDTVRRPNIETLMKYLDNPVFFDKDKVEVCKQYVEDAKKMIYKNKAMHDYYKSIPQGTLPNMKKQLEKRS
jgi:hypothetical protein